MSKILGMVLCAGALMAVATPALAGVPVPAPVIGTGLGGLVILGVAGAGYLVLRLRNRRD